MKYSHTDNGGKYIRLFDEYCIDQGIKHERIVPKTPQHNGIVERMSHTIKTSIGCMLSHVELPGHFGEAMRTACYSICLNHRNLSVCYGTHEV